MEIKRVALYIRVSTEEQVKKGYSIDSQKSRLKEYSNEHNYKIVDYYIDKGKSARSKINNRTELMRLLDDIKENKIDRIIIWRLDRWFRNIADYYKVEEILQKYNVDWECSDEEYNTTTANGRLYLNIKLSIAQNESDQTGDRIKFVKENQIKNGKAITGTRCMPLGYKVTGIKGNKYVIKDEEKEEIVIEMFKNYKLTKSLRKTLNYINNKYDLQIKYSNFRNYMSNTLYIGKYKTNNNYCEPYISEKEFNEIQDILSKNNKDNKKAREYIFTSLLKCPNCKHNMGGFGHRTHYKNDNTGVDTYYSHPYYRCYNFHSNRLCTYNKAISERKLEEYIISHFMVQLKEHVLKINEINDNIKLHDNTKEIKKLKERQNRLNELYIAGRIDKFKYDFEYLENVDKIEQLKKEGIPKTRNLNKYNKLLKENNIFELYSKLSNENKRSFWIEFIDYIVPNEDGFTIFFKE